MNTPIVPDHVFKMWDDPRFEILAEVDKLLTGSKTWAGMEYTYHPIHPDKYKPVAVKVRQALDDLKKEYGVEE
jgi:hypothetical protein